MATIASQKSALEKWVPVIIFDVTLKDATPRYWAKQTVTFGGNSYLAIVLEHTELKVEGNGIYGVDAVMQIGLTLNNADANLNSLITPTNWQGGIIQPRFIFVGPDGTTTTDAIIYPKFLIDLPTATWPKIEFSAHNKWNLARKMLPVSLVTKKDRYPFPDTAAERTAAGSDSGSEFFAIGYDPATGKGNWKTPPATPYLRSDYDGTREKLKEIGLEVRYGGFGKVPPSIIGTPKKGEKAEYVGNANEAKYGTAVPLIFGICRTQPIVLDTGFPTGWLGARLSHYLLCDGVTFAPNEGLNGIQAVLDVFIPDNPKFQRIPQTSNRTDVTGAWSMQGGYYGSQQAPASSKYRNIVPATDFPQPDVDFADRDLYSGLAYLAVGFPKELSGQDGIGPKLEAIVKGLKIETWDSAGTSTWQWTDNPVWIFIHLLKLLRWSTTEMDKTAIYNAAAYCDVTLANGKKRFRCNLPLTSQTRAADILRGIRNNCRMYTSFAQDGKLQLKIAQNVSGEGGLAFTLDNTNIMRGDDGQLLVEKFHRSVFETANIFSVTFQNEDNFYNADSFTRVDVANVNQIDEKVPADSIFPMIGIPSFDQAERQIEWARQEQVTLNEYYRVVCSLSLIEARVGQIGTITESRHGLISQQCRIRSMAPGPDAGTVELVLQKHSDGAYTDQSVSTPFTRAQADSSYTPRSVGGKNASSPAPVLTEITVADPINADQSVRRIRVEFKPPAQAFEGSFTRATKIRDVVVNTSGGSIPGGQVLFAEIAPIKAGARGLASEYLMVNVPSGGNLNSFSLTCELPPEADQYILFVGNYPGQTYEQTVAASPGTAPFSITVTNLNRNFGSIPPDPAFDHAQIFYSYNSSPDVLRDGGRTFVPDQTTIEFEPEAPAAADTQVTVYVSSANAAEDDFYPINVSPKATLTLTATFGPAQGWTATLLPGPTPSSVVAKFTRPTVNGKRLFWVAAQVKDSGTGAWRELDSNAGAAVTYYDGSAISHESIGGLKIKKDPGQPLGFGTAKADDLIMLDVAGGSFDKDRCQWGTVEQFLDDNGAVTTVANARYLAITGGLFRPQTTQNLRMKIVKPPHTWTTEGYLGDLTGANINGGVFFEWVGDREGDEFVLAPREIGRDINSVDVRFWIENDYCRSGGNGTHSTNAVRVRAAMDLVIPGPVQSLSVTGANGEFVAKWLDPATGAATIDDVAIQYATDSAFTTGVNTSKNWGDVNTLKGTDPGKTYYWRVAVHNLSDKPSDSSTSATLGATGWGPWTPYGAPTAVSSGAGAGIPSDSVIPGAVQGLVVTGANGDFVATWTDPLTGNITIDDVAIQYATNSAFTLNVTTAPGWGPVNRLRGTDPEKTYYFRIAVHNTSGLPSDSSTSSVLGSTGWGPWTTYGAPTAVSSGTIPGAGYQAPGENLCPNGSFEIDTDNDTLPDYCTYPIQGGTAVSGAGRSTTQHRDGTYSYLIPTGNSGIALGGFAVTPGDQLSASVLAVAPNLTATQGFYFRLAFHSTDRQFAASEALGEIAANVALPSVWTEFKGQVTVPAGMYWCRVYLYNVSGGTEFYFDNVVVTRTTAANDIGDNTIPPGKFTGSSRTEFTETFEESLATFWQQIGAAGATISILAGQGVDGGGVARFTNSKQLYSDAFLIPYDPRKLYRMTARARAIGFAGPSNSILYIGIRLFDVNKAILGVCYPAANFALYGRAGWGAGVWNEITGYFKGLSGSTFDNANDPTNPTPLLTGTVYISPVLAANYPVPGTASDITEIDDVRIDILEETQYTTPAPNGSFQAGSLTVRTYYQLNDPLSSAASLYWVYTQGINKADRFAVQITDGSAYWVERVRVAPGASATYEFALYRLNANRTYSVNIVAEGTGAAGVAVTASSNFPDFTPNSNTGTSPASTVVVGWLDWAGGNVWYDSYQYRNNIPPSNGLSSITVQYIRHGSGGQYAVVSGMNTYVQGTYIATHLAILVRTPSGTIDLNVDSVVTYMKMTSLPSSFWIPLNIADNQSFSVAVASVAECKNGRVYNTTYSPAAGSGNKAINDVWIFALNGGASEQLVTIGHSSTWNKVKIYGEFYMHETGTGTQRLIIGGNSTACYFANIANNGLYMSHGANPNFGLGVYTFEGTIGNGLRFKEVTGAPGLPNTAGQQGAYMYCYQGGGYWYTTLGNSRNFAAAGPHCAKCGYDYWLFAGANARWNSYLAICGWCGAKYKKGPKKAFHLLTDQEKSEIIGKANAMKLLSGGAHAEDDKPERLVRRRNSRPTGECRKGNLRHTRRRTLRSR